MSVLAKLQQLCMHTGHNPLHRVSHITRRHTPKAAATVSPSALREPDEERSLRLHLAQTFPNALLLEGSRLPDLYSSKHYVNLTNGLELVPLLQQLQLPFSVVRIRSTSLEQQAFESLLLELDANLLLTLALGHSCIIWDAGCRHRKTGAPRALWYGLEFIRFALNRTWCSTTNTTTHTATTTTSSSSSRRRRPHIRGHDVSRDFEAACRSLHPSTKTRLRYYKRYVSEEVQQHGVCLAGAFRRTDRDEDAQHFVGLARQYCGSAGPGSRDTPGSSAGALLDLNPAAGVDRQLQQQHAPSALPVVAADGSSAAAGHTGHTQSCEVSPAQPEVAGAQSRCLAAYQVLVDEGVGVFSSGLSHTEYRALGREPV